MSIFQLPLFINAGISLFLIFFAPLFKQQPLFLTLLLLSLLPISLPVILDQRCRAFRAPLLQGLFFTWIAIQIALIFAAHYFSDDVLRHIHDGYWLLQKVDVYSTPPELLTPVGDKLPNHPERGSIYFPITQMQAMLGAIFSPQYGFLLLYSLVLIALGALSWQLSTLRERQKLIAIFYSPWFLIFAASHHADLQGFMILLLLERLNLWRSKEIWHSKEKSAQPYWQSATWIGAALLSAAMIGLKPEGSLWFLAASLFFFMQRPKMKPILLWSSAALLAILLQALFTWKYLYLSPQSLKSFFDTVHFYMNWLVAYNPWTVFHLDSLDSYGGSGSAGERTAALLLYRKELAAAALLLFLLLPALWLRQIGSSVFPSAFSFVFRSLLRPAFPFLFWSTLITAISLLIASRSVWHPWYFLWLLPALNIAGRQTVGSRFLLSIAQFISWILPLFYLPIIWLRADGEWEWQNFYLAFAACLSVWLWIVIRKRHVIGKRRKK